jgi:hypothetical protein
MTTSWFDEVITPEERWELVKLLRLLAWLVAYSEQYMSSL